MSTDDAPKFAVRVLTGAQEGTVAVLEDRIDIGRSSTCEIQLMANGVSRVHAAVIAEGERVVLLDLVSKNGTFADGKPVSRLELSPGQTFTIGNVELIFEYAAIAEEGAPARPHVRGSSAWEPTRLIQVPSGGLESVTGTTGGEAPMPYPGNLLGDIVVFRKLHRILQRGGSLPEQMRLRYDRVSHRLRVAEEVDPERKAFLRIQCDIPGRVRVTSGARQSYEVRLLEVAVDGGKITAPPIASAVNDLCWLSLPLVTAEGLQSVIFTARVVWVREDELGLVFTGVPAIASNKNDHEEHETLQFEEQREDD